MKRKLVVLASSDNQKTAGNKACSLGWGFCAVFKQFSTPRHFSVWTASPSPPPAQVLQTVEAVEKVTFQKLIFEKWDEYIEKCPVFFMLRPTFLRFFYAFFELVVGDFFGVFSSKGFFDTLVTPLPASKGKLD